MYDIFSCISIPTKDIHLDQLGIYEISEHIDHSNHFAKYERIEGFMVLWSGRIKGIKDERDLRGLKGYIYIIGFIN